MIKKGKVKVAIFEYDRREKLELVINEFIEAYCLSVIDIKFHVDDQVDPE